MKKILLLKTLILLALVMLGGRTYAQEKVSDVLTSSAFGVTGTSYKTVSGIKFTSSAVYTGNMAASYSSIQLRSNNSNSGIVTTASGGKVKSITVVWNSNTKKGRTLDVYGKKTAYTAVTDLYGSNNGTKLGSIVCGTSTELVVNDDYEYIGLRSNREAMYLDEITITYESTGKTDRGLAFAEPNFIVEWDGSSVVDFTEPALNGVTAGVAYSSSVETVATVNPGTGEITITGYGATTITAAAEETETYKAGEDSYTIKVIEPVSNVEYEAAMVSVKNDVYYAMSTKQGEHRLYAVVVDVVNGKVIDNDNDTIKWQVDENAGTIRNCEKYVSHVSSSSSSIALNDKSIYNWEYTDGIWYTKPENRYLGLGNSTSEGVTSYFFRAYSNSNNYMTLYPPAVAMPFVDGYVRAATIGRFGTICLPYAVAADDMSGMTVYSIAGKKMNGETPVSLVLEQVEAMEAGRPYIFKATASKIVAGYSGEPAGATSANGLVGVHEGITLTASSNAHVLSNNAIKKVTGNVTVGDNRAYINMDQVPVFVESGNAKRFVEIGYGDIVNNIETVAEQTLVDVYNITGVRIRSGVKKADATVGLKKGLYIVGGRKVIIR